MLVILFRLFSSLDKRRISWHTLCTVQHSLIRSRVSRDHAIIFKQIRDLRVLEKIVSLVKANTSEKCISSASLTESIFWLSLNLGQVLPARFLPSLAVRVLNTFHVCTLLMFGSLMVNNFESIKIHIKCEWYYAHIFNFYCKILFILYEFHKK